ncbi:hypothetical protein Plo01_47110 [Planobispora longispora]|uniref:Uncharacterized protein n=1 Tax=Planobispora longispora TaxID=28887 RepID=A0A8J3RR04_9ACTN|nr:hypothetical protein Plo01_47110 [Planobispora longispora]
MPSTTKQQGRRRSPGGVRMGTAPGWGGRSGDLPTGPGRNLCGVPALAPGRVCEEDRPYLE